MLLGRAQLRRWLLLIIYAVERSDAHSQSALLQLAATRGRLGLWLRLVWAGGHDLKAPMPGIVVRPLVALGDSVKRGQGLLILEAMKMQNELASDADGVVTEILVSEGQMVEAGALLLRVSEEEA